MWSSGNPFAHTNEACVIEFEFQCGDVTQISNDPQVSFAFFLNGENIAMLPCGVTEVTINIDNYNTNTEYFIGNDVSEANGIQCPSVEADGFTRSRGILLEQFRSEFLNLFGFTMV